MELDTNFFDFFNPDFHPVVFEQRADSGDINASISLVRFYRDLNWSDPSLEFRKKYLYFAQKLADSNDLDALFAIRGYSSDKKENNRIDKKIYNLCKDNLNKCRNAENLCNMANCYINKICVGCNNLVDYESDEYFDEFDKQGYQYYYEASKLGSAEALCKLSYYYSSRNTRISFFDFDNKKKVDSQKLKEDAEKSKQCLLKAVELGYPRAYYALASSYDEGDNFEKNHELAIYYYKKAAELNYIYAIIALKDMYMKEGNYTEAIKFLNKLALWYPIKRRTQAIQEIIAVYEQHSDIPYRDIELPKWYKKAFEFYKEYNDKIHEFDYELGVCYEKGLGVEKNIKVAMRFFADAAEFGSKKAQERLYYYKSKQNNDMVNNMPSLLKTIMFKLFGKE